MRDVLGNLRHWRLEQDAAGILWLTLDRAESAVNSLSAEVLGELELLLGALDATRAAGLVVRSGKAGGFIAGADIGEFGALGTSAEAHALVRRGQEVFRRLEELPMPTVAMIHGFCLGGGLELALACSCRVASDDPATRLGLPEIKLGIHPGFGGTVRLTRLLGPVPAMDLMLTGRTVAARAARKLGLVDTVVPERHLSRAAVALVLDSGRQPRRRPPLVQRLLAAWPLRPLLAHTLRRQVAARAAREHYPAPYALIDLWARTGSDPEAMYQAEAASVAQLITGSTARNLVRVFQLQETLKGLGKRGVPVPRCVHVVGGGAMGGDIAAWCALQGLLVTVQDVDAGRLAKVVKRAEELFRKRLREPREVQGALDRLVPDPTGAGAARADVVIEAIFEDAEAKKALYRSLEPRMKMDAILATNTSSIPLEQLAVVLERPERFVGLHFFNPVARMQLVEVVTTPGNAADAVERATGFVGAIRRLPLPVKSSPGFLVNRILMPYLMEALTLVGEGVPPAEIDRAALAFGMPMGPVLLADTVGLDICLSVARILVAHFGGTVPRRLEEMVAAGHHGKKTGRGFYAWRGGKPVVPRGAAPHPGGELERRLMLRMLNEAVACLREQVTRDETLLDAGVVFGTGFAPFRGGPVRHCREEGIGGLEGELRALERVHGARFAPDPGWTLL
jgi:3-hydroxyacyl-CoA dehydrogenase/enoyl-CoA hydratase/3-hydroxybutyryl-CoA epimerase